MAARFPTVFLRAYSPSVTRHQWRDDVTPAVGTERGNGKSLLISNKTFRFTWPVSVGHVIWEAW